MSTRAEDEAWLTAEVLKLDGITSCTVDYYEAGAFFWARTNFGNLTATRAIVERRSTEGLAELVATMREIWEKHRMVEIVGRQLKRDEEHAERTFWRMLELEGDHE